MENTDRNKSPKNGGIGIFIGIAVVLIIIVGAINGEDNPKSQPTGIPFLPTPTTQITQNTMPQTPPKEEPKKVTANLKVTSTIIKQIDDQYRYFFEIKNAAKEEFRGRVLIQLITKEGRNGRFDTWDFETMPIAPNTSKAMFFDASTGPVADHGDAGISNFEYEVKINSEKVQSEKGTISSKIERL